MGSAVDKLLGQTSAVQPAPTSVPTTAPTGSAVDRLLNKAKTTQPPQPAQRQPIVAPPAPRVGVTQVAQQVPQATVKVARGIIDFFTKNTQNLVKTAVENLGSAAAYHLVPEVKKAVDEGRYVLPPMKTSQAEGLKKIAGQAIGSAAELASFAKGAKVVATAGKTGLKQVAKQGAISGAKYGTAFGVGQGLQDNKSAGQIAIEGVKGGATGAAAGALLSTVIGGIAQKAKRMKAKPVTTEIGKDAGAYTGGVTIPQAGKKLVKPQSPLLTEAKKYKSAEEFVDATVTAKRGATYESSKELVKNVDIKNFGQFGKESDALFQVKQSSDPAGVARWVEKIKAGERPPVVAGSRGFGFPAVRDGHNRLEAYRRLGFKEVPTLQTSSLTSIWEKAQKVAGGSSRANQSIIPDVQRKIESDPKYTARLAELGGGKVKSNPETLQAGLRQVNEGLVTVETIASHRAGTPINEDAVAAAAIIKDHYEQKWIEAMNKGDKGLADEANAVLQKIAPGYKNITATPGRATQIQSQFGEDKMSALYKRMRELQDKQVPFKAVKKELETSIKTLQRDEAMGKLKGRAVDTLRALENYATAAKLTSPITHGINTISNALVFGPVRGFEKVVKAGAQLAQGNTIGAEATIRNSFGTRMGLRNGIQKFAQTLVGEAPEFGLKTEFQQQAPGAIQKFAAKHTTTAKAGRLVNPFRWLSAADNFWKSIIQDSELHTKAFVAAKTEGLTGKAFAQKVNTLVNNPPSSWVDEAANVAKEYTFQSDPDKLLKAISKLRNLPGGRLVVPFIQTPYNIVKFQVERSALGLASLRNISGILAGGEKQADAVARLAVGAGLSYGAWELTQKGEVTGAYPTDSKERAIWEAEGRKPYSIKIGDKWLAYNRFQPVGLYLTQAAAVDKMIKDGNEKGAGEAFAQLVSFTGQAILDLPFVQGLSGVMDAIQDPQQYAERSLTSIVTGFVPNVLRDVRQQTDITKRDARGIVQGIMNMVPGQSQKLQPKIDVLGREKTVEEDRWLRASKVITTLKDDVAVKIMKDAGYNPTEINRAGRILESKGKKYEMKPAEFTAFKKDMGGAVLKAINNVTKTPGWKEMDKDEKSKTLSNLIEKEKTAVRDSYKKRYLR